ncbi:MFS transporter [uncultured Acinetobacter sp.]|uniref:MFS transporter n=1 Tax=uncultured Acinetobacter sp. TaxID=165433 RepID=UPI00261D1023|nr:MFS transporter [uncultured Acinetobacter sp.]
MLQSKTVAHVARVQAPPLSAQRLATLLCFFSLGFSTAAWAPLIPFAQQRLSLNHADFGGLLLCAGIGSMLAMPLTGMLIQKMGGRLIIAVTLAVFIVVLPLLAMLPTTWALGISLFAFGAAAGSLGVAINLQAVMVEKQYAKNMMSSFHGMCSLGGLLGVMSMTVLLALGLSPLLGALIIAACILLVTLLAVPKCLQSAPTESEKLGPKTKRGLPSPFIVLIGIMCFIAFLSEGSAMDWSGIYLTQEFGVDAAYAGLAYTCFAITMTMGRFAGRRIQHYFGEAKTVFLGALMAGLGLSVVILAPHWLMVLLGYSLLGLGCANIVPIMFSRVGRQNQMPKAAALSYVSTFAYTGSLLGPALVGLGSEVFGLTAVFAVIAIGLSLIAVVNYFTLKHEQIAV